MILKKFLLLNVFVFIAFFSCNVLAQAKISIQLIVSSNAPVPIQDTVWVGLDETATDGIDPALNESNLPALPPSGTYDIRFLLANNRSSFRDYRNAPSFPYTGKYTHEFQYQQKTGGTAITIMDQFGGILINSGVLTGTGSYTVANPALTKLNVIVDYTGIVTNIEDQEFVPGEFHLSQNFPNPFNPSTKIKYSIGKNSSVLLKVYDILGNEISTLVNEEQAPGLYEVNFKSNLSSGFYFYRLQAGNFIETKSMLLIK